ncbi:alpha-L-fucosidase [Deminuibacter soli]|uniref:alpha-L-fucosidase n=1 Tax=Deminuibacter soli TaxID=2291815 RepID=A0A3E1NK07_9BACT|nr:alpha-L-fucosidase [Deminuibacter soli]RFM28262.1 glycoside hydrolase family 29 (alpha-L-fucosidase) [Deminuibacter soli]
MKRFALSFVLSLAAAAGFAQTAATGSISKKTAAVKPYGPLPTPRQLTWQEQEFYLFVHFGPNTFTNLEWGKGTEHEEVFNPTHLDCNQWCRIAKAAGAKGIILTAKHHDGFCLWPSNFSTHTVAQSKWRGGKGDVLKELAEACKRYGLKIGVYLSPWDRNHPAYGTPVYNKVYVNMMKEVVARYGPLFEFWWDGANGEGPSGKKQVYDFPLFERTIRTIAPNTAVFSDIGPDMRWVGNENGVAGNPNWSLLDTAGYTRGIGAPKNEVLNNGNPAGKNWIPAECDVSIRPGWFYHNQEDSLVKTPDQLLLLYLKSQGRNAAMLLNVPPNQEGLFAKYDSASLVGFKLLRDTCFGHSLLQQKGVAITTGAGNVTHVLTDKNYKTYAPLQQQDSVYTLTIHFATPVQVNCLQLQEPIQMGQRVKAFTVEIQRAAGASYTFNNSTIGYKRIVTFPTETTQQITIRVTGSKTLPLISELAAYEIPERIVMKNL